MPLHPSLHQSLYNCLQSTPTDQLNPRSFELTTLCTKPFRTYTLFPHALDPTIPIMRTDYLITLAERFDDYRSENPPSATPPKVTVPVFGLEASLYTIPSTGVQILYVSKIDTSGLSPLPAPAGLLITGFLSHFLENLPKSIGSLRIHIFARASREGQYLFPASAENAPNGPGDGAKLYARQGSASSPVHKPRGGKRLLDDQQLVKWWHKILSEAVIGYRDSSHLENRLECSYILPGFDHQEALEVLPVSNEMKEIWKYGHPYNKISGPLSKSNTTVDHQPRSHLLSDLIPAFDDDPKSRFLHAIGDCLTNPAGEPGDWDDAIGERSTTTLENDRRRERNKINHVSPDEFWDRMGARQECCDGRVSAFFVLVCDRPSIAAPPISQSIQKHPTGESNSSSQKIVQVPACKDDASVSKDGFNHVNEVPKPLVGVPRNVYTSLWSQIHNKDYAKLETAAAGYSSWIEDVKSSVNSAIGEDQLKRKRKLNGDPPGDISKKEASIGNTCTIKDPNSELPREAQLRSLLSFDNCHSALLVHNALKNPPDCPAMNGLDTSKRSLPSVHAEQKSQVNVLQPRKRPKKSS